MLVERFQTISVSVAFAESGGGDPGLTSEQESRTPRSTGVVTQGTPLSRIAEHISLLFRVFQDQERILRKEKPC